jgi:hypothetical protein
MKLFKQTKTLKVTSQYIPENEFAILLRNVRIDETLFNGMCDTNCRLITELGMFQSIDGREYMGQALLTNFFIEDVNYWVYQYHKGCIGTYLLLMGNRMEELVKAPQYFNDVVNGNHSMRNSARISGIDIPVQVFTLDIDGVLYGDDEI